MFGNGFSQFDRYIRGIHHILCLTPLGLRLTHGAGEFPQLAYRLVCGFRFLLHAHGAIYLFGTCQSYSHTDHQETNGMDSRIRDYHNGGKHSCRRRCLRDAIRKIHGEPRVCARFAGTYHTLQGCEMLSKSSKRQGRRICQLYSRNVQRLSGYTFGTFQTSSLICQALSASTLQGNLISVIIP